MEHEEEVSQPLSVPAKFFIRSSFSGDTHSQSAAMPAPTLEFAAICLRNALFLLPSLSAIAATQSLSPIESEETAGDSTDSMFVRSLPGPPIKGDSILVLR